MRWHVWLGLAWYKYSFPSKQAWEKRNAILGMNFHHTNDIKDIGMYVHGSALYLYKKVSKEHGIYQNVCTKIKFDKTVQQTQHGSIIFKDYKFRHPSWQGSPYGETSHKCQKIGNNKKKDNAWIRPLGNERFKMLMNNWCEKRSSPSDIPWSKGNLMPSLLCKKMPSVIIHHQNIFGSPWLQTFTFNVIIPKPKCLQNRSFYS